MSTGQPATKQPTEGGEEAPRDDAQKQETRKQPYQKQPYQQGGYQRQQQPRQQHMHAQQGWTPQQMQAMQMQGMIYGANYQYPSPFGVNVNAFYQTGYAAAQPQYAYNPYAYQQQAQVQQTYTQQMYQQQVPVQQPRVQTTPAPAVVPPAAPAAAPVTAAPVVEMRANVAEFVPRTFTPAAAPAAAPVVAAPVSSPAPAAAATATATTTTAPAPRERKKFVIKSADGVAVDLEEIAKAPAPVKAEEPAPAKPAASQPISIPSMPVTVSQAAPADVKTEKTEVVATPAKAEPVVEEAKEVAVAAPEQATRRLVPQLNRGSASKTIKKYTKQEILDFKPAVVPKLNSFPNIVEQRLDGPSRGDRGDRDRGDRDRDRGASEKSGDWKSGGGGKGRGGGGGGGGGEWKHEAAPKKKSAPPKKEITDPMQLLEGEVVDVLNKITPDKFERLSKQLLDMELKSSTMVEKIVELVFDKAVKDHNFAEMYAELCQALKLKSPEKWVFHKVVKNLKDNDFFWIKDFDFPATVAGPFFSKSEIYKWDTATMEMPPMNPFTASTEGAEYVLSGDMLMQIIPQKTTSGDQYYVSYTNFANLPEEKRSKEVFATEAEAAKSGQSLLSFRTVLAHKCEKEFGISVSDDHLYDTVNKQLNDLIENRASITEEEYFAKEREIMEQRFKLKARMIGTILFIGELYRQKMLNTGTMHDCIAQLLGPADKKEYDVQDLELLCKLMTTLGQELESKSKGNSKKPQWETAFNGYFERMEQLSKDKSIDSRIRFTIQDVLAVRANNWKQRREKEGPLKISEIHEKVKQEEKAQLQQQAKQADVRSAPSKGGASSSSKGRPGDARNDRDKKPSTVTVKSRSAPAPAPAAPAVEKIDPKTLDFKEKSQQSKMMTCVKEFLGGQPIEEVRAMIETPVSNGYLVQAVLKQLVDLSLEAKRTKLLEIFHDEEILKGFSKHSAIVEAAVEKSESVKMLVDSSMDNLKAPEILAGAVRMLVQKNIVALSKLQDIVPKFIEENIALELSDPEEINDLFGRFLAVLNS